MRVLHVIDSLWGGGAEASLLHYLMADMPQHITHAVISLSGDENSLRMAKRLPWPVSFGSPSRNIQLRDATVARAALKKYSPDIIHCSLFRSTLATAIANRTSIPNVVSLTSAGFLRYQEGLSARARIGATASHEVRGFLLRRGNVAIHAVSQAVADAAIKEFRLPAERVTVIPRGRPDISQIAGRDRAETRGALGLNDECAVVMVVAREDRIKNHVPLLHATARMRTRRDIRVVFVGSHGLASPDIDHAIHDLGLAEVVLRLGQRDDVPDLMKAADVIACTSIFEGLPGAIVEALSMSVPVVAFEAPGVVEALGKDHPGLVPLGEVESLAERIGTVLDDRALGRRWAASGRLRYESEFSMPLYVTRLNHYYETVGGWHGST